MRDHALCEKPLPIWPLALCPRVECRLVVREEILRASALAPPPSPSFT